ncbi:MAG: tyrosine-type recombinase/integrase [Maribacter sp.]|uniref:tyrosine-type recombinase/integrase n=1 Tax=Maribacter sp. TaxID=1897614 RepID=UPI003C763DA1
MQSCTELAKSTVPNFEKPYQRYRKAYIAAGYSESTCKNYLRALSQISLHYGKSFHLLDDGQITDYIYNLRLRKTSHSSIKLLVYGYRFLFKIMKTPDRNIELKGNRAKVKVPVVLNQQEVKSLLDPGHCPNLKHRIILSLLYSSGLRISELLKLRLEDIDFNAHRIHIMDSKNGAARYVVLAKLMAKGLKAYIDRYRPEKYLINGHERAKPYSRVSVTKLLARTLDRAGIGKHVTIHSLRHSFAIHFLEQGGNILQLKEQLGHNRLQSTLIYLRVAKAGYKDLRSPLDVLYNIP